MRVTIAARRSELARIQAYLVGEALRKAHPHLSLDYSFHESLGDRNQTDPLWKMPEKGVFTQDLREGLRDGRFDLAVHSWKDLAIEDEADTEIAATLPRADLRDLLLVRSDRWTGAVSTGRLRILTSSPRRSYNLEAFLPEVLPAKLDNLEFVPVRGNVPTRVRKMWEPEVDGLVVAKAALDRLLEAEPEEFGETRIYLRAALAECRWMILPLRANPAAPGQGALAIEIKRERNDLRKLLNAINCAETFEAVLREREILRAFGGGCHQKIGVSVLRRSYGEITSLRGLTEEGTTLNSYSLYSSKPQPPKIFGEQMWPVEPSQSDWFVREKIPLEIPNGPGAFWVAKAEALPAETQLSPTQIVWASGIQTWKRLAQRGVWVNGCAEGLGEQEDPCIGNLINAKLDWFKLTHASGANENGMRNLATYRLVPKSQNPDLTKQKYFFWLSGSAFERALALNPWLKEMTHFCGPGNTQQILARNGIEAFIFLDHAQWLEEMRLS